MHPSIAFRATGPPQMAMHSSFSKHPVPAACIISIIALLFGAACSGSECRMNSDCSSGRICNASEKCVPKQSVEEARVAGAACGVNKTIVCGEANSGLYCENGVYRKVTECPPSQACAGSPSLHRIACGMPVDSSVFVGVEGGVCARDGEAVCSIDRQLMLECVAGVWVSSRRCPPSACTRKRSTADSTQWSYSCANDGFSLGDRCGFKAGAVVCSTDLKLLLQCSNGFTTTFRDCASVGN